MKNTGNLGHVIEYRASMNINYSTLKSLQTPWWIKYKINHNDLEEDDKPHLRIGDVLDILLTQEEAFQEQYCYYDKVRPSGMMLKFIDNLDLTLTKHSDESLYEDAYQKSGYKTVMKKVIDNLWTIEKNKSYYEFRTTSVGKAIISKDEMDMVIHLKTSFISNPFTKKYFLNSNPNVDLYYQVPIYFEDRGVKCKALLDLVVVDHEKKLILPIDLKTSARGSKIFESEIMKNEYFLQAGHYRRALECLHQKQPEAYSPVLVSVPSEYTIDNFRFIVASKTKTSPARIWKMSDTDSEVCRSGGYTRFGRRVRGVDELLDDYKWHLEHNLWEYSREMYENNGEFETELFRIETNLLIT